MRWLALLLALASPAGAETALIAVATNFGPAAEVLARDFANETVHDIRLSTGSTGKLAAQIGAGAPYDAFLAADSATPAALESSGVAVAGSRFTYAIGRISFWTAREAADLDHLAAFVASARHVAIANPELAPYGKAAMQAIENLGISADLTGKIVRGENVGQAFAMIHGGAADGGFVATSLLRPDGPGGTEWPVPENLHDPIEQDAILLRHGHSNEAARAFLEYLGGGTARATIARFGYGPPA